MGMMDEFLAYKPIQTDAELGAYEYLWQQRDASTKRLADLFRANPGCLPSELVSPENAEKAAADVLAVCPARYQALRHSGQ